MKKEILVLCPGEADWGLVSQASRLLPMKDGWLHFLTDSAEAAEAAFAYGADQADIFFSRKAMADDYCFASWLREKIVKDWKPEIVLAPATIQMRAVMPILAGMLNAGLTADCTGLVMQENGNLLQIRPALGNNLMAQIETVQGIQMATVRPGIFRPDRNEKPKQSIREYEILEDPFVKQLEFLPFEKTCPLSQADLIFAGGKGIGSKEGFQFLEKAARKIGAAVGASRMAVDAGFAPYSCQVGQTGVVVHPQIYVAVGISGAVQHLAGMSGAEKIIAINSDERAPIFGYADYGIVGDWREVISKFIEKW